MNDLAVLKLRGNGVVSHATVSAACLPAAHTVYSEDTWCYVTGWGFTTSNLMIFCFDTVSVDNLEK